MKKLFGYLFSVALGLVLLPLGALAMTVSPPNYDYTSVNRGDVLMDVIKLSNEGNEPVTIYPMVRNFTFKQGDETSGTPSFYDMQKDPYGTALGTWVKIDTKPITVGAGQKYNIPFTINIPNDASPGGHFGAVLFATQPPDDKGVVTIGSQVGVLIMMRVNGDVKEVGSIAEFGFSHPKPWYNFLPVDFFVRFENSGNVHLRPTGNVFIFDWTGRQVAAVPVNADFKSVLPQSIRRYEFSWSKNDGQAHSALWNEWNNFAIGKHKAQLVLTYGVGNKTVSGEVSFYVWPWRLMSIALGILLLVIFMLTIGKKSYEKSVIRKYERRRR